MTSPSRTSDPVVTHHPDRQRFDAVVDGHHGELVYRLHDRQIDLVHTEVDSRLQGRGVGAALVRAALVHAEAEGLTVKASCSYAAGYIERHPETHRLQT